MNYIYLYIDKKIQELCHYFAERYSFVSTITDRNKWTRNGKIKLLKLYKKKTNRTKKFRAKYLLQIIKKWINSFEIEI